VNHPIKVLIVDDDEEFHQGICKVLESAASIAIAGQARDGQEAVALTRKACPDVVLVDIGTSPAESLQIIAQVSKSFPDVRIVVLNENEQGRQVLDAFRKGALGHLSRTRAQSAELVHAIRAAARGEAILSPDVAGHILDEVTREKKR
jgi:DNA-binding NarL/FixJ family response regulator